MWGYQQIHLWVDPKDEMQPELCKEEGDTLEATFSMSNTILNHIQNVVG